MESYLKQRPKIRLLVMDVDGTLTDGTIFISGQGELCKAFYVRDGHGIKHILPQAGIEAAIITGRSSEIVSYRAKELGIKHIYQGISGKAVALKELKDELGLDWREIAFIGDDINDQPAMDLVGWSACPADAATEVKAICDYICVAPGGRGAVRECIDRLVNG